MLINFLPVTVRCCKQGSDEPVTELQPHSARVELPEEDLVVSAENFPAIALRRVYHVWDYLWNLVDVAEQARHESGNPQDNVFVIVPLHAFLCLMNYHEWLWRKRIFLITPNLQTAVREEDGALRVTEFIVTTQLKVTP